MWRKLDLGNVGMQTEVLAQLGVLEQIDPARPVVTSCVHNSVVLFFARRVGDAVGRGNSECSTFSR